MNEYRKAPPVGSNTFTQLLHETLPAGGGMSIAVLSGLLGIQQFYVLNHLWLLKLTNRHLDIVDKVTGVDYTTMPAGLREAIAHVLPEAGQKKPSEPPIVASNVEPPPIKPPEPQTKPHAAKKAKHVRKYGRLCDRIEEFVNYIRANPPKTVEQLAKAFGVESNSVRRYLYAMYNAKVNMDVPRKVLWKAAASDHVPNSNIDELLKYPVKGLVEVPPLAFSGVPKPQAPVAQASPTAAAPTTMILEIEKLALRALRDDDMVAAKALGQALALVEKNTTA